jgi:hypothetical protein
MFFGRNTTVVCSVASLVVEQQSSIVVTDRSLKILSYKAKAMKMLLVVLALLTLDGAKASEFSVRCEGRSPSGPYFATFDTDAKIVVFETASPSGSFDGINVLAGELSNADGQIDSKIEFTIRVPDLGLRLTYDTKKHSMIWPGISSGDPFRPTLTHPCSTTPPRSILSFRSPVPILRPITIRCSEAGYMYLTLDTDSKRGMYERDGGGSYPAMVVAVQDDRIELQMTETASGKVLWNKNTKSITFEGIDGKKGTPKPCEEIAPRTMIEFHKRLKPH